MLILLCGKGKSVLTKALMILHPGKSKIIDVMVVHCIQPVVGCLGFVKLPVRCNKKAQELEEEDIKKSETRTSASAV